MRRLARAVSIAVSSLLLLTVGAAALQLPPNAQLFQIKSPGSQEWTDLFTQVAVKPPSA